MRRPHARTALVVLAVLVGATACDDGSDDTLFAPPEGSDPSASVPDVDVDVDLPPDGEPFVEIPDEVIVTSDGTVYRSVPEPEGMAPTPIGPPTWERAELTAAGWAELLAFLDEHEFLSAPPDYGEVYVTDVGSNRLIVTTADTTWEHEAYVDYVDPEDADGAEDAYERFGEVLDGLRDLPATVDGEIGDFEPYVPEAWDVILPFGPEYPTYLEGEVAPWPFDTVPVEGCTTFPDDDVAGGATDVGTGRYEADDVVYDVAPRFPWDGPC